jgi:hypothetical protein
VIAFLSTSASIISPVLEIKVEPIALAKGLREGGAARDALHRSPLQLDHVALWGKTPPRFDFDGKQLVHDGLL